MTSEEPLPLKRMLVLYLANCAHFYSICSVFSYVGVMSVDLGWASNRDDAGFVAGFVQSANLITRVFSAGLWGWASQRFGMKASLLASLMSTCLGSLLFGFCTSLWSAVLVRGLFLGFLNGNTTILCPLAAEVAGPARSAQVLVKVMAVTGFVVLAGPALGGWTYAPDLPFPALVPNLIGSVLAVAALLACWFWLPDDNLHVEEQDLPGSPRDSSSVLSHSCREPLQTLIMLRGVQGYLEFGLNEAMPLWAISSGGLGGLNLSQNGVGAVLMLAACITIPLEWSGVELLLGWAKPRKSLVLCSLVATLSIAAVPFCSFWSVLVAHSLSIASLDGMLCAIAGMCNNRIPRECRGPLNGLIVTVESVFKGVAPATASICFAWSLSRFGPAGRAVVFVLMGMASFVIAIQGFRLPSYVDIPLDDENTSSKASYEAAPDRELKESDAWVLGKAVNVEDEPEFANDEDATDIVMKAGPATMAAAYPVD